MEHIAPKEEIDWFHHQQDSLNAFLSLLVFARGCIEISRIWDRKIIQCSSFSEQQKIFFQIIVRRGSCGLLMNSLFI